MKSRKTSTLAVLVGLLLSSAANASAEKGWAAGFVFGADRHDLDELDAMLVSRGFNGLDSAGFSTGFSAYRFVGGNVIIGFAVQGSEQTVFTDAARATVRVGSSRLEAGYVIREFGNVRVFPLLGIGRSGVDLRIVERAPTPTFADVLERPFRESSSNGSGFTLQFALGVDYFLRFNKGGNGRGGLLLGTRLGYAYKPAEASWEMKDREVLGGPDVKTSGPFIHFMLGGGRFGR